MKNLPIFSLAILSMATTVAAQQASPGLSQITFSPITVQSLDAASNTYSGYMHVDAIPCPGKVTFSVNLVFSGAKDLDDARDKLKLQKVKLDQDIAQAANACAQ